MRVNKSFKTPSAQVYKLKYNQIEFRIMEMQFTCVLALQAAIAQWVTFGLSFLEYLLRFRKVGTLVWARPFPADTSSTSSVGNSRAAE